MAKFKILKFQNKKQKQPLPIDFLPEIWAMKPNAEFHAATHSKQAQSVPSELPMKLFGSLTAITFSPIVTIEPRRRKFHCPIRLKIPLPAGYRSELGENLRLLCSISGGQSKAVWEDVTGSTPLSITSDKCLLFTTTVSARFWLVHCQRQQRCKEAARFAQELWRHLIRAPFMARFVLFAKRRDINEAQVRAFCMTDDKEERTLEVQEHYTLVAKSREVEVLEGQWLYLEFGGNLLLAGDHGRQQMLNSRTLINEQLALSFRAFEENRLAFLVRLKEVGQEASGRIAFMEDSLKWLASLNWQQRALLNQRRRRAVCTLGVQLPPMCVHYDNILGTPKRNSYYAAAKIGALSLTDIAQLLAQPPSSLSGGLGEQQSGAAELDSLAGSQLSEPEGALGASSGSRLAHTSARDQGRLADWMELAPRIGIPRDEVEFIAEHCSQEAATSGAVSSQQQHQVSAGLLLLMHWFRLANGEDRDQDLARGLLAIGRGDIVQRLEFQVEPKRMSRSTMELLREIEAIPVRSSENLYAGSELSAGRASSTRASSPARGASLRRLDQEGQQLATSVGQHQRAGSASLGQLNQRALSANRATLNDANRPGK